MAAAGTEGWMAVLGWLHDTTSLLGGLTTSNEPILVSIVESENGEVVNGYGFWLERDLRESLNVVFV